MRVLASLDTNADLYEMSDAWETPPKGTVVNIPEHAWACYQAALDEFNFWQDYIATKMEG